MLVAQDAVQRARALGGEQLAQRRRVGPRLRPERRERVVGRDVLRAQDLDPRALARPELAQAQLVAVREPDEQARGAIAQRGALVEQLQAPGRHEVHEQGEVAGEVDDEVLAPRRTPVTTAPSSACSGGSNVFSALMPGASADSTTTPRSAPSSRRAVISTSGNSGTHSC